MFVPPEQRSAGPKPEDPQAGPPACRSDSVLLWLIVAFVSAMLLAPIGGSTLVHGLRAVLHLGLGVRP